MKKLHWFLSLLLLSLLSYTREILFLGINEIIDQNFEPNPYSIQPDFFRSQSASTLIKIKFVLTALFSLLFALITTVGLKLSFIRKFPFQLAAVIYSFIFILSGIIGIIAAGLGSFQEVYPFLRGIIDYLHNPLIFIILSSTILATNLDINKRV